MSEKRMEDVIMDVLKDDAQRSALDLAAYLRAGEIATSETGGMWEATFEDKPVCYLFINGLDQKPGPWTIWSDQEPGTWIFWSDAEESGGQSNVIVDGRIRELAWENVNFCANCGGTCAPGKSKTVLGREFDNLCGSAIAFTNPDTDALECAKNMIDARKRDILENIQRAHESTPG